jgi:hypothetical protein
MAEAPSVDVFRSSVVYARIPVMAKAAAEARRDARIADCCASPHVMLGE